MSYAPAYVGGIGYVIRQRIVGGRIEYAVSRMLARDEGDYWDRPPRNQRWRRVTSWEVAELLGQQYWGTFHAHPPPAKPEV